MIFEFFDPGMDLRITAGKLPHWYQPDVTYFITYRTDDSLPIAVAELWYRRRNDWLRRHGVDPKAANCRRNCANCPTPSSACTTTPSPGNSWNTWIAAMAHCVLKRPDLAAIVADNLRHFDGERYTLADFVVMPNHVHLLACLLGSTDIVDQCSSWKKYHGDEDQRGAGERGRFWHEESFDCLVRTPEQCEHLRRYIADNPKKVGLHEHEYVYWSRQ